MFIDQELEIWCSVTSTSRKRTWLLPQVLLILITWFFMCWLYWDNDGLWFGDAPQHAANGLFWKDYLLSFSFDPKGYALSYYARYPVIAPTKYPPVFYIIEGVFCGIFGPSPYIAKGIVLVFTLIAALYMTAWCRRWISENVGWAGMLFILLPGVVRWSHAIMLNIPALALSIGALYHFRRWLESPPESPLWHHLYIGVTLAVLSILTYVTSCVLILIVGIWLIVERRWTLLWNRRVLIVIVTSALALLPWFILIVIFESKRIKTATGQITNITSAEYSYWRWAFLYYPKCLPQLFGTHLLFITAFGIASGILIRQFRHETILMLIMTAVCLIFFTYMPAKDSRYILLMSVPIVIFCLVGLLSIVHWINKLIRSKSEWVKTATITAIALLLIGQMWLATKIVIPSISGYKQLLGFIEKIAPEEPVFYDGRGYDVFTFFMQARDPDYRRRVVLGNKLLYVDQFWRKSKELISSPQEVVEVLRKNGGCQWLAVTDHPDKPQIKATQFLREAIKGPQFELVKSFPITKKRMTGEEKISIGIYRFLVPIEIVDVVEMPFMKGELMRYRIKPIQRQTHAE